MLTDEQLEQLTSILGVAEHEIRSPLMSLRLTIDKIARTCTCPDRHIFDMANRQIKQVGTLLSYLLDAVNISGGKLKCKVERVPLCSIVIDVVDDMEDDFKRAECDVAVDAQCDVNVYVRGDSARLIQVIGNLLTNACKYAPKTPIEVTISKIDNMGTVRVRDNGPGIPENKLSIIFKKFERLEDTRNIMGWGLGLWVAKQIIDFHGGYIVAYNHPERGAIFEFAIPLWIPD